VASKHTPYFELLEALQAGSCPLCALGKRATERYLDTLIYEQVNDPGTRRKTRAGQGFCRLHAWQLRRGGGALGIGILYRDVVRDLVETLNAATHEPPARLSLRAVAEAVDADRPSAASEKAVRSLQAKGECPACMAQHQSERMYADILVDNLSDPEVLAALDQGPGLCLPHLRLVLERTRDEAGFGELVRCARNAFALLLADLDEMIRLSDYRHIDQHMGDVGDAWLRAITQVAGKEGLS